MSVATFPSRRETALPRLHFSALRRRLASTRLDRELADGLEPTGDPLRSRHAEAITSPGTRRGLANCIHHILDAAEEPASPGLTAAVPLRRAEVRAARPALRTLAERLRDPAPCDPRGVAMTRRLLEDGTGPLYWSGAEGATVDEYARTARLALERGAFA